MRSKLLLLVPLLLAGTSLQAAVDPFYQNLLRDGQAAFDRKDYPAAVRHLRLACFGMLDEPHPLVDCLARLALAQDRAEDLEGFRETFRRLAEVESRFNAYTQGGVAPELRTALEARLVARLPAATLESEPAFRPLVAKKAPAGGGTAKKPNSPALVAKKTEPAPAVVKKPVPPAATTPPPAPAAGTSPGAAAPVVGPPSPPAPAGKAPAAEVKATAKPDSKPLSDAERKKMEQARQLLSQERPAKELKEAFQLAREVADAHPGTKEAQHLAAEAAYRISRWSDAATYFHRGGDPGDDEPERLFYLAVALHELGDDTAAAAALKRALPNLRRTPYVDSYAKTILGQ
ncbi:MAG: hypothetical protein WAM82_09195 [Thermoanaerobaculia bacterium]